MAFAEPEHYGSWGEVEREVQKKEGKKTHVHRNDAEFSNRMRATMDPTRPTIPGEIYVNDNPPW